MPATRTATASARYTSTPWRVSGHCSAPGCVRIAASRKRSCQSTSASLSSCTTRAGAEKPCSVPLSLPWSGDVLHHPGSRQESSSFTYKGQAVDVKRIGHELGVRYVLEGSVRKGGNRVRITGQLIDATTNTHLWADRFDGMIEDVLELQDKIAVTVSGVIEPALQ